MHSQLLHLPVTNSQWLEFCAALDWPDTSTAGADHLPVCGISWLDATAYALWAGGRLPTEEELIEAEAGLEEADWSAWPLEALPAADDPRLPVSATGDVAVRGCLRWWTSAALDSYRVYRGGSWYSSARFLRVAYRDWSHPSYRLSCLGFRLAFDTSSAANEAA
jgi:formylglycine-generating enzyme required for sulfatase activity